MIHPTNIPRTPLMMGCKPVAALVLTLALAFSQIARAAERPDGFAQGVTGGGTVAAVHPHTPDELKTALCGSFDKKGQCTDVTPRVIVLDHRFDFRGLRLRQRQQHDDGSRVHGDRVPQRRWAVGVKRREQFLRDKAA